MLLFYNNSQSWVVFGLYKLSDDGRTMMIMITLYYVVATVVVVEFDLVNMYGIPKMNR